MENNYNARAVLVKVSPYLDLCKNFFYDLRFPLIPNNNKDT